MLCKDIAYLTYQSEQEYDYLKLFFYWDKVKKDALEPYDNRVNIKKSLIDLATCCFYVYADKKHINTSNRNSLDKIAKKLNETYVAKNIAYGDSFGKTFKEFGIISALTRLSDKVYRIETLYSGVKNTVKDEKIEDSLLDSINYIILTFMELDKGTE